MVPTRYGRPSEQGPIRPGGASFGEAARDATEVSSRGRLARRVAAEVEELRRDRAAWSSYLEQAESTYVADGLD